MNNLGKIHLEVMKWIMRYLRGTSYTCSHFTETDLKLERFVDANLDGDIDSKKKYYKFYVHFG